MRVLHRFEKLLPGILEKRYKRFLADIRLEDGRLITAFTPNSGSMKTCSDPGYPVMVSETPGEKRKTGYTLEMVRSGDTWVGVNTFLANTLGARIIDGKMTGRRELGGFSVERREVSIEDSRFDLLASDGREKCVIEIKNVTWKEGKFALFPDAVTKRGKRHLDTLTRLSVKGMMACGLYIVQRSDCEAFAAARDLDPAYAESFQGARKAGVLLLPYLLHVRPEGIFFRKILPVKTFDV